MLYYVSRITIDNIRISGNILSPSYLALSPRKRVGYGAAQSAAGLRYTAGAV